MLTKILDWVAGREPVATSTGIAAVVTALLGVAAAFGAPVTETQVAAIGALAAALAGYAARRVVSPVMTPDERKVDRMLTRQPTVADDSGQLGILIGIMIILILAMVGLFALCGDDDENGMAVTRLAYHEECDPSWDDCGQDDYSQDYSSRDRNRNRGRNRGAFSPGPFDDSPVDAFNGNTICLPGSTCYGDRRDEPPPDGR